MSARNAPLLAALLLAGVLAGCASDAPDARAGLVPYPRLGDAATYQLTGAYLEFARWENGHALATADAQVRFTLSAGEPVQDAARAVLPTFRVLVERSDGAGFVKHADRYVSPEHQAVVQSYYPHSQDQGTLAFDERGLPWLFGASVLFGTDLAMNEEIAFELPDNLGLGHARPLAWRVGGPETLDGVETTRFHLEGAPGVEGTLWMERGNAWPLRARLAFSDDALAPHVRVDGPTPVAMEARRVDLTPGETHLPARNRGASFADDPGLPRAAFDGEKPPDGDPAYVPYPLEEAVRDVKLVDAGLAAWLDAADDPRLYRGTYIEAPRPADHVRNQTWLLSWMESGGAYYTTQVYKLQPDAPSLLPVPLAPAGVPLLNGSGPAPPPKDDNHGWFPAAAVREDVVTLSEGVRVVRDTFGAQRVEIFLRSFREPAGYSYYIDGGFEDRGRYTVVFNPTTGLIENATGYVPPVLAAPAV